MNIYEDGHIVTFEDGSQAVFSAFESPLTGEETGYTVGEDESLFRISNELFKKTAPWYKIAEINNLADPIEPTLGLALKIPVDG